MKKALVVTIISIFAFSILTGCVSKKQNEEDGTIQNNINENVVKNQKVEEFEFTNTSIVYEDGKTTLTTVVTNTSNEKVNLIEFKIHVKDKDGNEIIEMIGFVGEELQPKESRLISSYSIEDLSLADTIEYEIVR